MLMRNKKETDCMMKVISNTKQLLVASAILHLGFFLFGLYQDLYMDVKYTDIDYLVFTDAAKFVYYGESPYLRDTYRYTPLLALVLMPCKSFFHFGKLLFMLTDLCTGVLIMKILKLKNISNDRVIKLSSIWLLNPMVITISSRGNAESLLICIIMSFLYYFLKGKMILSGIIAGLAVHFKIYPIIYIPSVLFYLGGSSTFPFINKNSIKFGISCALSFVLLTSFMYLLFGFQFLYETYLYHLIRVDHRHNFSVYNLSLYYSSAGSIFEINIASWAFLPQLLLSCILIPYAFAKIDLISTFFIQTFAFVTFNKVITSQYFIWYLCFLPFYLKDSKLLKTEKYKGVACIGAWVLGQAIWLYFAYNLEFLGEATFYPGLFFSSCLFFIVNVVLIGVFCDDLRNSRVKQD